MLIDKLVHYRVTSANFLFHGILFAHDQDMPVNAS